MSKFRVGDRIRRKSDGVLDTVRGVPGDARYDRNNFIAASEGITTENGSWSFAKYWELITEGGAQMARKTYKLIKDTPTVKKGAIYQEACDDGTQEYIILDQGFIKDVDGTGKAPIYTRSLVEGQPQWFVEVFQVEPQFMTREELDRWEAFQAAKPKKTKTVALKATPAKASVQTGWTPERRAAHSKKIKAAWAAKKAK